MSNVQTWPDDSMLMCRATVTYKRLNKQDEWEVIGQNHWDELVARVEVETARFDLREYTEQVAKYKINAALASDGQPSWQDITPACEWYVWRDGDWREWQWPQEMAQ